MKYKFAIPLNTPEGQKEAIMADEKLITVGAGAGSGKTWVLSNRYARLLINDESNLLPKDILTLTFTEAAAGEMQDRIESLIRHELEKVNVPEDSTRKQEIIDGMSDLWISTIHSFAARLIRESGLSLDIDPRASVISTHQTQDFWQGIENALEFANLRELARAYGNKILRDAAKSLDNDEILSACVNKWGADNLRELAGKFSELHACEGRTWEKLLAWSENDELITQARPHVKNLLRSEWLDVWNIWSELVLPGKISQSGESLRALIEWQKLHINSHSDEELKFFYEKLVIDKDKNITATSGEPFKTAKNLLGMRLGDWRKLRPGLIKTVTQDFGKDFSREELQIRHTLMKFCAVCWGMWDEMKRRRGLLSFSDMILYANEAVSKGGITRKFSHILIDEFQDTDPLQFSMIESLIDPEKNNTSLFAVGDPQQSIYMFRHADPTLFADTIRKADKPVKLNVSFRTRDPLLRVINNIFRSLWGNGLGRSEAMKGLNFTHLHIPPNKPPERDDGTMPVFRIILARHSKNNTNKAKQDLAENLAFNIYSWVNEGRTIWDKKERLLRPVKYSDFAVLTRSRSIYPVLEEAFTKFNIKTIEDTSNDFFNRGEINDIVCLLRAAADIHDSFAVSGWLMSPFSGVSESEAVSILTRINESENVTEILARDYPEIYSRLEYLSVVGEQEGPAALLSMLDKNRKGLACYRESDKLRVLRNLRRAVSIARSYQEYGTSTLTACAEYLTRAVKNGIQEEEPGWNDENENAVKLNVVHSAKGLEYPVTVIFESRTRKRSDYGNLRPSRDLGVVFSNIPDEMIKDSDTEIYLNSWDRLLSEQGDLEEETRLFYVAATRAQDTLIFCGLVNEKDDEPHNNTWTKFLLDNCRTFEPVYVDELDYDYLPVIAPEADERILTPVNVVHAKNSLRQFSATSFALFSWCPFAWRRKYKQGLALTWESPDKDFTGDDESGGADLGSLTHWILSRWPSSDAYESELEYLLYNREIFNKLPGHLRRVWREGNKQAVKRWLMNFAESELGKKLMHEKNLKREYRFMTGLTTGTTLAGAVDALYENNLIDYKITAVDEAPMELYESQVEFYAYVLHELIKAENVNTCTVFLREGKIIRNVYSDFDAIRSRIINASEKCASGPYEANTSHCALCPFKKGCVKSGERL